MATSKIRIRVGDVEVEYEGEHEFVTSDLTKLLTSLLESRPAGNGKGSGQQGVIGGNNGALNVSSESVAAIAARLQVKSGPELIIAAATKLTLVDGTETFGRDTLVKAMRSATAFYKKTYFNNLSGYLKTLQTSGRLTETADGKFALTAAERTKQETASA